MWIFTVFEEKGREGSTTSGPPGKPWAAKHAGLSGPPQSFRHSEGAPGSYQHLSFPIGPRLLFSTGCSEPRTTHFAGCFLTLLRTNLVSWSLQGRRNLHHLHHILRLLNDSHAHRLSSNHTDYPLDPTHEPRHILRWGSSSEGERLKSDAGGSK